MAIYESEQNDLERIIKYNVCAECGRALYIYLDMSMPEHLRYASCPNQKHQGIERIAHGPADTVKKEMEAINKMTQEQRVALRPNVGISVMTEKAAMTIINTLWPTAPDIEKKKAMMICRDYNLNPLLKQLYILAFKHKVKGQWDGHSYDYAIVHGIETTRIQARRQRHYSYLDLSPRAATQAEVEKINGEFDDSKIWAICILRDQFKDTFTALGSWPKDQPAYGAEKGNTQLNMAKIRAERAALKYMCPELIPAGTDVYDERYVEMPKGVTVNEVKPAAASKLETTVIEGKVVEKGSGEVMSEEPGAGDVEPDDIQSDDFPPTETILSNGLNLTWVKESLAALQAKKLPAWSNVAVATHLRSIYQVDGETLTAMLEKLTKEQVTKFVDEVSKAL
jgi:hypothetical protein